MPNTVATGSPDTAASAAGNPAPSKPWTAAPLWVASAAPATSAPIPNTAASPAPSAVSIRPWPMSRPVMPLSADADCWKNTIHGVTVAPIVLHAGVSSPEKHELPMPERFTVPMPTARLVNGAEGRVVAVGTTVVRALESAARPDGTVVAASGWTDLVLGPRRPARVVTGLISGLHAPEASHLLLLEAVAGAELVGRAYDAAVREDYLWHEFGDSTLFLP